MFIYSNVVTVEVAGGETEVVTLPAPARAELCKVIVVQGDGDAEGFTLSLFSREDAANQESDIPSEAYRIAPDFAADSEEFEIASFNSRPYVNQEGTTVPTTAIYGRLTNSGSGAATFHIAYTTTISTT